MYFKENDEINNIEDFTKIHHICKYWGMKYLITYSNFEDKNKKIVLKFYYSLLTDEDGEINYLIDRLLYIKPIIEHVTKKELDLMELKDIKEKHDYSTINSIYKQIYKSKSSGIIHDICKINSEHVIKYFKDKGFMITTDGIFLI